MTTATRNDLVLQAVADAVGRHAPALADSQRLAAALDICQSAEGISSPTQQRPFTTNCLSRRFSRWSGIPDLYMSRVDICGVSPDSVQVETGKPCRIEVDITATVTGSYSPRVSILIMTDKGIGVARLLSDPFSFDLSEGEQRTVSVTIDRLMLVPRDYNFSVALFKSYDPDDGLSAERYELLARSFRLSVAGQPEAGLVINPDVRWHSSTLKG